MASSNYHGSSFDFRFRNNYMFSEARIVPDPTCENRDDTAYIADCHRSGMAAQCFPIACAGSARSGAKGRRRNVARASPAARATGHPGNSRHGGRLARAGKRITARRARPVAGRLAGTADKGGLRPSDMSAALTVFGAERYPACLTRPRTRPRRPVAQTGLHGVLIPPRQKPLPPRPQRKRAVSGHCARLARLVGGFGRLARSPERSRFGPYNTAGVALAVIDLSPQKGRLTRFTGALRGVGPRKVQRVPPRRFCICSCSRDIRYTVSPQ